MNRKKPQPAEMESSSGEEDEEDEEDGEGDETASGSSSEDDDFDSADERVKMIPAQNPDENPSQTLKSGDQNESSSESEEEDNAMKPDTTHLSDATHLQTQQNVQTFGSDVESEYETDSSSESEGLTQKSAKDMGQGSPVKAIPLSQKMEDVKKGKNKAVKQQQKDPPPPKSGKSVALKNVQEESQSTRKGQGGLIKEIASDNSVRDDKKSGKRKLESLQNDTERDSADSASISKKRKDADMAHNGKKSAAKDIGIEDPSYSKKGVDRGKVLHTASDVAKEIAKKTLNNPDARGNGLKDVLDSPLSENTFGSKARKAGDESKQEKKASNNANNQPTLSLKPKKPHVWSLDEEMIMASEVLNRVKMGLEVPSKKNDDFWVTLVEILQEKMGVEFSKEQLSDKLRRLKQRHQGTVQKIKEAQESNRQYKHKNSGEQSLYDIFSQIWGRAEMISLEGEQEGANDARKDQSKPTQSPCKEGKGTSVSSPKAGPSLKADAGKAEVAVINVNNVGGNAAAISHKPDQQQVAREDEGKVVLNAFADGSSFPTNDVHRLFEDKINATLHELQERSKRSLEEWMNKAYGLIEESTKKLEDQARRMSWMGIAGGGLPSRICDAIEFWPLQGDESFQQQWYELQLQELNVHVQRLELMRKEYELKQEQIKLQLQVQRQK